MATCLLINLLLLIFFCYVIIQLQVLPGIDNIKQIYLFYSKTGNVSIQVHAF